MRLPGKPLQRSRPACSAFFVPVWLGGLLQCLSLWHYPFLLISSPCVASSSWSPWDRNSAFYGDGTDRYVRGGYLRQCTELAAYGRDRFMMWSDGVNGGDGYYGGVRTTRPIDPDTYYNMPAPSPSPTSPTAAPTPTGPPLTARIPPRSPSPGVARSPSALPPFTPENAPLALKTPLLTKIPVQIPCQIANSSYLCTAKEIKVM